jgi:hypothetical protein
MFSEVGWIHSLNWAEVGRKMCREQPHGSQRGGTGF